MQPNRDRIPGWQEYLQHLKDSGIWDDVTARDIAREEWLRLANEQ